MVNTVFIFVPIEQHYFNNREYMIFLIVLKDRCMTIRHNSVFCHHKNQLVFNFWQHVLHFLPNPQQKHFQYPYSCQHCQNSIGFSSKYLKVLPNSIHYQIPKSLSHFKVFVTAHPTSRYQNLYQFPMTAPTNYQKLFGLHQQKFIISQFWRLKIYSQYYWPKTSVRRANAPSGGFRMKLFLAPSKFWKECQHSLDCSCITLISASLATFPLPLFSMSNLALPLSCKEVSLWYVNPTEVIQDSLSISWSSVYSHHQGLFL